MNVTEISLESSRPTWGYSDYEISLSVAFSLKRIADVLDCINNPDKKPFYQFLVQKALPDGPKNDKA